MPIVIPGSSPNGGDVESALYAFLSNTPGVENVVGTRIYPVRAPEGSTAPFVVYHKITGPSLNTKDGSMHLAHPRFQITCWASKYAEAVAVVAAVKAALDAYTGPTMQGLNVPQVIVDNERDMDDPQSLRIGRMLEVVVWHSE